MRLPLRARAAGTPRSRGPIFALVVIAALLFGCGETANNEPGAEIVSLTIEPNTLSLSETGMTDEYFTATLVVDGFTDEIDLDEVTVFIQEPPVDAEPGERDIDGNTITLSMIAKSWFAGLEVGTYDIGAEVSSATEQVRQLDLATVTVEE